VRIVAQLCEFSGRSHKHTVFTSYYEGAVNNDTMFFQAIVAALVCLTSNCVILTECYLRTLRLQLNAKGSDFEADEELVSWIGKGRDVFYSHKHSDALDLYDFKFKLPVLVK